MTLLQITAENWASGHIAPGFVIPPISRFLGSRFESHDLATGVLRLSFPTKPEYATPAGTVNGGMIAAMLDDAMGALCLVHSGGTKVWATTDLHTQFFKPVAIGPRCFTEARMDRMGRAMAFTSAALLNEKNEICARCVHTAQLIELPSGLNT
jgi:uncharacterized protein (TIGR00369 family)